MSSDIKQPDRHRKLAKKQRHAGELYGSPSPEGDGGGYYSEQPSKQDPKNKKAASIPRKRNTSGIYTGRYLLVFVVIALIFTAIIGKLLYVQFLDAPNLRQKARLSRNQSLSLFNRGRILDRNGVILAQDTIVYDIYAHNKYYHKLKPEQIAKAIGPILNIPVARLREQLSQKYSTISVKKNVSKDIVDRLKKVRVPVIARDSKSQKILYDEGTGEPLLRHIPLSGLDYAKKPVRNYPQGTLSAHVLGYVNDEAKISSGIEYTARKILKKKPRDVGTALLSGKGDLIDPESVSAENLVNVPKAEDVTLTIDSRLQYLAERELALGLKRTKAKRGTVIMLDPKTGEMLAFASLPNYQPDRFYKATADELKNWAITDVYPPGSTFKILTVAFGLEAGVIQPDTKILDTGRMKIGGWQISNYDYGKRGAPGMIDLVYLLMHSSNIASAKIALMTPKAIQRHMVDTFGFGRKTNIDLPGESAGILHPLSDWSTSLHGSLGYGYGIAATPLQMAAAIAAIGNNGVWVTPHVLKDQERVLHRRVLSAKTATTMTHLLVRSINEAKTSTVRLEGINIAGKTGTSRKHVGKGYANSVFTSFVAYYPAEDPKALMMVVIDSPGVGEAWGSTVAGPIFKAIAQESIGYLGLKPVKIEAAPRQITKTSKTTNEASASKTTTMIRPAG